MSSTTIHVFGVKGVRVDAVEFRNGHTAPCLWQYLWKKYMARPAARSGAYIDSDGAFYMDEQEELPQGDTPRLSEFWRLHKDQRLSWFERVALRSTYDHIVVRREHFLRVAEAFDAFTAAHVPAGATHVWHLPGYAEVLRRLANDEQVLGIGWTQTSVCDMFVGKHTDESEELPYGEYLPYDLNTRDEHHFMELEGDELHTDQPVGMEEGQVCRRNGCDGVIEYVHPKNCRCHRSPPCEECVQRSYQCDTCGAYPGEEK